MLIRRSSSSAVRSPRVSAALSKSMFSSWSPTSALVAGVKIGSGSCSDSWSPDGSSIPQTAPLGLLSFHPGPLEPRRQLDPAARARGLVVLPAGPRDVAAHDALDREHLEPLHEQRAAAE